MKAALAILAYSALQYSQCAPLPTEAQTPSAPAECCCGPVSADCHCGCQVPPPAPGQSNHTPRLICRCDAVPIPLPEASKLAPECLRDNPLFTAIPAGVAGAIGSTGPAEIWANAQGPPPDPGHLHSIQLLI